MLKRFFILIFTCIFIASITTIAFADVWVRGYYRKDGTYVSGHWRSNPDGNPYNNWSYPGNINPHTGKIATGNPSTYLKNYYDWKATYKYHHTYYNDKQFNNWFEKNKDNKQFTKYLNQYKKEKEKLKQVHRKRVFLFILGIVIGYAASQSK